MHLPGYRTALCSANTSFEITEGITQLLSPFFFLDEVATDISFNCCPSHVYSENYIIK
jgi:hypothetical protein